MNSWKGFIEFSVYNNCIPLPWSPAMCTRRLMNKHEPRREHFFFYIQSTNAPVGNILIYLIICGYNDRFNWYNSYAKCSNQTNLSIPFQQRNFDFCFAFVASTSSAKRHSSWRRNSMRKTRPIHIPEHNISLPSTSTSQDANSNNQPATRRLTLPILRRSNDTVTLVSSMEPTSHTPIPTIDAPEPEFKPSEQLSVTIENELNSSAETVQPRTLADEFLNTLTQSTSDITDADSSFDFACPETHFGSDDNTQNRPRQLGRRAEGRVRVLSITAETNSLGNQVCFYARDIDWAVEFVLTIFLLLFSELLSIAIDRIVSRCEWLNDR